MQLVSTKVSVIAHSTEDLNKVKSAINALFSQTNPASMIEKKSVRGHFGNEITTLTLALPRRLSESFLENLWRSLSSVDRERLVSELDDRLDEENKFHVRLDKQECYRRIIRLKDQDPIKIQVGFGGLLNPALEVRHFLESLAGATSYDSWQE